MPARAHHPSWDPVFGGRVASSNHAHITRLRDNHAATKGSFAVRFKIAGKVVAETSINGVARAGIFTPEGPAPAAGSYALEMAYTLDDKIDVFDCGNVVVADAPPKVEDDRETEDTRESHRFVTSAEAPR